MRKLCVSLATFDQLRSPRMTHMIVPDKVALS